jgi:hypothetical protein
MSLKKKWAPRELKEAPLTYELDLLAPKRTLCDVDSTRFFTQSRHLYWTRLLMLAFFAEKIIMKVECPPAYPNALP